MKTTFGRILPVLALLAFCAGALPLEAYAATGSKTITFTRPTTYTDGSPLAASAITGYRVECEFTPTGGTMSQCATTPANLAGGTSTSGSVTFTYPPEGGTVCFRLRTLVGSLVADASNQACSPLEALRPNPPTNVTVTVTVSLRVDVNGTPTLALAAGPVTVEPEPERPLF